MTVAEMCERMSYHEFSMWREFFNYRQLLREQEKLEA